MKSKTLIKKQIERKTNTELIKTIIAAKKYQAWFNVAEILSGPRRKRVNLNIGEIGEKVKEGEKVVVPGKVLSQGEITKKMKIIAFNFSEKTKDKLLKSRCEILSILDEIKKNPEAKGVKILK